MRVFLSLAVIFPLIVVFGCGPKETVSRGIKIADSDSYEATIFRQNCAICHGAEADGKTIEGKPIPSLRLSPATLKSEEQLYQQIANGKLPMPPFKGQLSESELRKMAKFIKQDVQGMK